MMDNEIDELYKSFIKFLGNAHPITGQVGGVKITIKPIRFGKNKSTYRISNRSEVEILLALNEVPMTNEMVYDFFNYKKRFTSLIKSIVNRI